MNKLSAKIRADPNSYYCGSLDFGIPAGYNSDSSAVTEDDLYHLGWESDDDDALNNSAGGFGYVSALVKPFTAAASAVSGTVQAVKRAVTGKVALHPDSENAAPLQQGERRAVRKALMAKSAFTTLHMLGMVTAAAFPIKAYTRKVKKVAAALTRNRARGAKEAKAADGVGNFVPASGEDDEGI